MKNQTAKCISYGPEWQPDGTRERYRSIENASRGLRIVGASHDIIRTRDDICYARGIVRQWVRDLRTAGHALPPSTRETVRLRIRALRESVHAMHKRIGELTSNPYAMMEGQTMDATSKRIADAHWLITDDASAPDSMNALVVLGYYWNGGDNWICFNCQDVYHARSIIDAYACGSV